MYTGKMGVENYANIQKKKSNKCDITGFKVNLYRLKPLKFKINE